MREEPEGASRGRWLREPLLHFVLLGAALFGLDALLEQRPVEARAGDIVITQGRIENLAALFAKTWQRPPTASELRGLVDDYVLEEVLYREGMALGVHRDDTVIRRRVRQKMEFVTDDILRLPDPTDTELEDWLAAKADAYARPGRVAFRQVYLNADKRGDSVRADAERLLAELRSGDVDRPDEAGDATLMEHAYAETGTDEVARTFGDAFAEQLRTIPIGEWAGPVDSPYGLHLVLVEAYTPGSFPPLHEVREAVVRDWRYDQRGRASASFYEDLVARYEITIEWPEELAVEGDSEAR